MPVELNILPPRPRKYRFAITPLADAMFQLLIFFMLTSNLMNYSLLPIKTAPETAPPLPSSLPTEGGSGESPSNSVPDRMAIWIIEADALVVGGERFEFDRLETLAQALLASDEEAEVILIVHASARVQDLATVLARLKATGIAKVKLSREE